MHLDTSRDACAATAPDSARCPLPPGAAACLDTVQPEIRPLVLPGPRVREKLAHATPLLDGEDVAVDPRAVARLWTCLLDAFEEADSGAQADASCAVAELRGALATHRLHAEHLTTEALVSHPEHVRDLAACVGVPSELVWRVADLAARPILAAYARHLAPALRLGAWESGCCPVCGAWPVRWERTASTDVAACADVSAATDAAGPTLLRCGRCTTAWPADGKKCPFCQEPAALRPFGVVLDKGRPGDGKRPDGHALGCGACQRYLPISESADEPPMLGELAEQERRVSSGDRALHHMAVAEGFVPPTGVGFRLELADADAGPEGFDDD